MNLQNSNERDEFLTLRDRQGNRCGNIEIGWSADGHPVIQLSSGDCFGIDTLEAWIKQAKKVTEMVEQAKKIKQMGLLD